MENRKTTNIQDVIIECYSECPRTQNLHNDFSGFDVNQCLEDILVKLESYGDHDFFVVEKEGDIVGYFALGEDYNTDYLITFFVRPKYRNKSDLIKYWNQIKKELNYQDFMTGIFNSNTHAKNFLIKNGGELIYNDGKINYFNMKGERLCQ